MSIDQLKSLASSKLGFARSNQFLVELPATFQGSNGILGQIFQLVTSGTLGSGNLNLLCANVTMPGKQIMTTERRIGMEMQKVAYGYAVEDVNMTFYALNDYGIKKYFDEWKSTILDERGQGVKYKKGSGGYAKDIKIHQLRKPIKNIGFNAGPIKVNIGLGGSSVYSVRLVDAFPTSIQSIELNNELDGLVQLSVQFSYTNWQSISGGQGWITAAAGLTGLPIDVTGILR